MASKFNIGDLLKIKEGGYFFFKEDVVKLRQWKRDVATYGDKYQYFLDEKNHKRAEEYTNNPLWLVIEIKTMMNNFGRREYYYKITNIISKEEFWTDCDGMEIHVAGGNVT